MAAANLAQRRPLVRVCRWGLFVVTTIWLLSLGQSSAPALQVDAERASYRGTRYCEIFLFYPAQRSVRVEVWGTQGLGDCPAEIWDTLDTGSLRDEFGAVAVRLNGPRFFLMDGVQHATLRESPRRSFGELEMRQIGTVVLPLGADAEARYVERTIERETLYEFWAGDDVYELVGADGSVYVMQSYNQIVDPDLDESDLSQLGARLQLPAGWAFRARTLDEPLEVRAGGLAVVLQDDLDNTYQRFVEGTRLPPGAGSVDGASARRVGPPSDRRTGKARPGRRFHRARRFASPAVGRLESFSSTGEHRVTLFTTASTFCVVRSPHICRREEHPCRRSTCGRATRRRAGGEGSPPRR